MDYKRPLKDIRSFDNPKYKKLGEDFVAKLKIQNQIQDLLNEKEILDKQERIIAEKIDNFEDKFLDFVRNYGYLYDLDINQYDEDSWGYFKSQIEEEKFKNIKQPERK